MSSGKWSRPRIDYTALSQMVNSKWVIGQVELAKGYPKGSLKVAEISDAIKFGGRNPVILIDVSFDGLSHVRLSDCGFDLISDGNTYKALGDVLKVSNVDQKQSLDIKGATIELSGEISEYINALTLNNYIGGVVTIRVAFTDDDNNIISTFMISRGLMDKPQIKKTTKSIRVTIQLQSVFRSIGRVRGSLPVDTLHQLENNGDSIFQYVPEVRG